MIMKIVMKVSIKMKPKDRFNKIGGNSILNNKKILNKQKKEETKEKIRKS